MMNDSKDDSETTISSSSLRLLKHPGPHPMAHESRDWLRSSRARLGRLLPVAERQNSPAAELIVDHDLGMVPAFPIGHPYYDKRMELRMKLQRENAVFALKRFDLLMSDWTKIYLAVMECCEFSHPTLHEEIYEHCRLDARGVPGGYDGPMAWSFVVLSLTVTVRSKADKNYYDLCLKVQTDHRFPDHGLAINFLKKAQAFIVNINPNLSRPFTPADAGEHIIEMMPKCLAGDGRRLLDKLTADGTITDLTLVAKACEAVVFEDQSGTKANVTNIAQSAIDPYTPTRSSRSRAVWHLPLSPAPPASHLPSLRSQVPRGGDRSFATRARTRTLSKSSSAALPIPISPTPPIRPSSP